MWSKKPESDGLDSVRDGWEEKVNPLVKPFCVQNRQFMVNVWCGCDQNTVGQHEKPLT